MIRSEGIPLKLWDIMKRKNIGIMGIPEKENDKGTGSIFKEILMENFQKLGEKYTYRFMRLEDPKWVESKQGNNETNYNQIV